MRGQVKIVAYATLRKLTVTVLGVKNQRCVVGLPLYIKLSISSEKCTMESTHTMKVHAASKNTSLHETVSFNLSTLRYKRLTIEVWSSSVSPENFIGCTSFGLRKLTESARVVQGFYHLLSKEVGYEKHLSVRLSSSYHGSCTNTIDVNQHSSAWNQRRSAYAGRATRLLEHKEVAIPVSILQEAKFGCFRQSPPMITDLSSELQRHGLQRRDIILSLDGAAVSVHTNAEFQNIMRSLNGDVILKIQRINLRNTARHARPMTSSGFRKRKLQRRPVLQRKKRRTAAKDIGLESEKESSNYTSTSGEITSNPRLVTTQIRTERLQSCLNTCEGRSVRSANPECRPQNNSSHYEAQNWVEKSNEFQLCNAQFTYGRNLQKSAKIVRRRTVHNKAQDEEVDKSPGSPALFQRKTKGRKSFILRELSNSGKDSFDANEFELDHTNNIRTLRAAFRSASEADLRKPKRHSLVKPALFRLPFSTQKENNSSKVNQPEYEKLKKLFRKRPRKLKDEKYPSNGTFVAENSDEVFQPTLMSVLREKGKCANFRSFLAMEHSEENIAFWLDCESYKSRKANKRRKAADAIFRKFIECGAENEVNITGEIRSRIRNSIQSPTEDLFLEAQEYIYRLMESDPYRRFIKRRN